MEVEEFDLLSPSSLKIEDTTRKEGDGGRKIMRDPEIGSEQPSLASYDELVRMTQLPVALSQSSPVHILNVRRVQSRGDAISNLLV